MSNLYAILDGEERNEFIGTAEFLLNQSLQHMHEIIAQLHAMDQQLRDVSETGGTMQVKSDLIHAIDKLTSLLREDTSTAALNIDNIWLYS